jgi:uncharacterized protein (TIGR02996 family)
VNELANFHDALVEQAADGERDATRWLAFADWLDDNGRPGTGAVLRRWADGGRDEALSYFDGPPPPVHQSATQPSMTINDGWGIQLAFTVYLGCAVELVCVKYADDQNVITAALNDEVRQHRLTLVAAELYTIAAATGGGDQWPRRSPSAMDAYAHRWGSFLAADDFGMAVEFLETARPTDPLPGTGFATRLMGLVALWSKVVRPEPDTPPTDARLDGESLPRVALLITRMRYATAVCGRCLGVRCVDPATC